MTYYSNNTLIYSDNGKYIMISTIAANIIVMLTITFGRGLRAEPGGGQGAPARQTQFLSTGGLGKTRQRQLQDD